MKTDKVYYLNPVIVSLCIPLKELQNQVHPQDQKHKIIHSDVSGINLSGSSMNCLDPGKQLSWKEDVFMWIELGYKQMIKQNTVLWLRWKRGSPKGQGFSPGPLQFKC